MLTLGEPEVWVEVTLYAASADTLLERIGAFPDEVDDAMLVVYWRDGSRPRAPRPARRDRASENVPAGALAVLELDAPSGPTSPAGSATLRRFVVPRDL